MRLLPTLALLAATAAPAGLLAPGAAAAAEAKPYIVTVHSRVLFGQDGRAQDVTVLEADKQPAAFVAAVKDRLGKARIAPPTDAGAPATLGTGVAMAFEVTPAPGGGQGQVRVLGMAMQPLLLKMEVQALPPDAFAVGETERQLTLQCNVDVQGRCAQVAVRGEGMPESVRRWARTTTEAWRFEPQTLNGKPIESSHEITLLVTTAADLKPEDFREDKFDRATRGR